MVTPKHMIVLKLSMNYLTIYKPDTLAVTKLSFMVEIIYQSDL